MSSNWLNNIKHVAPGEPVKAGVVARPDRALADRTEYLKQRLDAAEVGRAVFDVEATLSSDVLPGQPVFWNSSTQRYELALAAVTSDPSTGALVAQASADCLGICYRKSSATLGDVVLSGIVKLPEIANAVAGAVSAGRYYLSATEPGKLTQERPGVPVPVCFVQGVKDNCVDEPWVVVAPQPRSFVEDHVHYRFDLVCRPAGSHDPTAAFDDGVHTITAADSALEGWLPADHPVFVGKAPAGAKFGYNLSQHDALARVWPPMPVQAVAVLWDKGVDRVGATEVPLGLEGLCVIDINGIWWMDNCYGEVPWPATLDTTTITSESSLSYPDCPRHEVMRVSVVFLRMVFGNEKSVVTSLEPATNSPITITNCDGLAAKTGDLQLGLNLAFLVAPGESYGGQAFKEITTDFKFKRGWVAEGIRIASGPVQIASSHSRALTAAEKTALGLPSNDTSMLHQGIVTLSYEDQLVEREISPQIIRLSDTVERLYQDIPYLGFPEGQDSLVRVRLNVPGANLGGTLSMAIRVQLFGRGGTALTPALLPPMTMTYRRLPKPGVSGTNLATTDSSISFDSEVSLTIDKAIEIDSASFEVAEGDTVLVTLARTGSADSYAAEVGMLRMTGIITAS